ncbi:nuclear transport factor 2 family protein [Plantactinospora soyae]|uniref:3-phenylpropionate/cinnamic acid dioxygenase small subunit n=1 Tax=Plantactinospora soyae TaxID=1544732 RepID=A0A927M2N9_9ACTN|nr:nuclear transport factor 2 family protein [Plantactinospora soyae]MBE1485757.1 3-phenylpropionate/cinnamic acid dioxygenase small subunit [Plantactinospora soyae]
MDTDMFADAPPSEPPSHRLIENLIATYAELVDTGDFVALASLFTDASFTLNSGERLDGRDAIQRLAHDTLVLYDDGTPRTKHVTTNVIVEVDEAAGTADSRSYFTVFQALTDFPLQAVACGRYRDRFERRDSGWRFVERQVVTDFLGDVSRHLRSAS